MKRIPNPFDMSQGNVDRDHEINELLQTMKSHLTVVDREQQGQASKLLEHERILSACRYVQGNLRTFARNPDRFQALNPHVVTLWGHM